MHTPDLSHAEWRKSTRSSGNGACIEVADLTTAIGIRDSKNSNGSELVLTRAAFTDLVARVKGDGLGL